MAKLHLWGDSVTCEEAAGATIGLKRKNQRVRLAEWQEMLSFAEACENGFDRWIYVLKNMETFNRLPWMAKDSVFHRLSEIADVSAMTKEERQKYDYAIRKYRDNLCVYEGVLQTGRAEGRAEGFELAQKQAYKDKLASARSFKTLGLLSNQQIAQALDLPLSEVEKA